MIRHFLRQEILLASTIMIPALIPRPCPAAPGEEGELLLHNPPAATQQPIDIQDIYGPLPLPDPINWTLVIAAVLAAVVLAGMLLYFLRRRNNDRRNPLIPPHLEAMAELERAREYLVHDLSLLYAERISAILRRYIEQRFNIRSTRLTTAEFVDAIGDNEDDDTELSRHKEALTLCLQQCDLAKFAHLEADRTAMEDLESGVRRFIEATTPTGEAR